VRPDLLEFLDRGGWDHHGELVHHTLAGGGIQGQTLQPLFRMFPEHLAMGRGLLVLGANGGEIAENVLAGLPVAPDGTDEDGFKRDILAAS
jgi:hypothetical protein